MGNECWENAPCFLLVSARSTVSLISTRRTHVHERTTLALSNAYQCKIGKTSSFVDRELTKVLPLTIVDSVLPDIYKLRNYEQYAYTKLTNSQQVMKIFYYKQDN